MIFRGWQKNSFNEWPGKICSVVWVEGCNFRCPFCYNPDLVLHPEKLPSFSSEEVLTYLKENQALLDGVAITGGEPLIQKKQDLIDFIKKVKALNLGVAIETNGSNPSMIEFLIIHQLVDYLAMDVKAPLEREKYNQLTGIKTDLKKIKKSIKIIKQAEIDSEFRTTVIPGLLNRQDILVIAQYLSGAKSYYLQKFQSSETVGQVPLAKAYSDQWFKDLSLEIKEKINIKLRI
jgi:pyruvate formate lyase activating enzyme